jgi:hypothetical protein
MLHLQDCRFDMALQSGPFGEDLSAKQLPLNKGKYR